MIHESKSLPPLAKMLILQIGVVAVLTLAGLGYVLLT